MGSFNRWSAYGSMGRLTKLSFLATNLLSVVCFFKLLKLIINF